MQIDAGATNKTIFLHCQNQNPTVLTTDSSVVVSVISFTKATKYSTALN